MTSSDGQTVGRPQFDIAIPIRNGVDMLPDALTSLDMQSVPLHCAVLDASGDPRVRDMLASSGLWIDYAYHRAADAGQAAAIQEGWNHLTGEIVGWLNTDDRLMPGSLEKVAALFAANPDVDVVYGQACYLDAGGGFIGYFPAYEPDTTALAHSNTICQPAAFLRRRALARIGGLNTGLHYTMDWDLWLRLRNAGCRFLATDAVLAVVINSDSTKTNSGGAARRREIGAILSRTPRGLASRLRGWLGIIHGEATLARRAGLWRVLTALFALRRMLLGRHASALPPYRYGLRPLDNGVHERCTVIMPVAVPQQPATVTLFSDSEGPFRLLLNNAGEISSHAFTPGGQLSRRGLGGITQAYRHTIETPVSLQDTLTAEIEGPRQWRLIGVQIDRVV